ncbi:hypothetical protein H7H48_15995 [Nitratireductor sp. B36]|uniref:hypothetical protein n=1 Tax=Nitratireductor sp. B36 TaxID=2762059 RepID=UPI001E3AAC6E|nr:hypothetical protein [Nitratireductor sp. B36]MCC5780564.1 hypothetical protein [Nitratireductor sp. B36]
MGIHSILLADALQKGWLEIEARKGFTSGDKYVPPQVVLFAKVLGVRVRLHQLTQTEIEGLLTEVA